MSKVRNLTVSYLSLVARPATGKGLTLKSKNAEQLFQTFEIKKTDDERMVAYGIVYAPDEVDSQGDWADETTIRRAAYDFMRGGRAENIDTEHSFNSELAYVAESWLVRKNDPLFSDEPEGAWAVGIQVGDPDIWKQLKSGELTGISLAGIAQFEPDPDDVSHGFTEKDKNWLKGWFEKTLNLKPQKETEDMTEEQVREIVRAETAAAVTDALKSAGLLKEGDAAAPKTEQTAAEPATTPKAAEPAPATAAPNVDDIEKSLEAKLDAKLEAMVAKAVAKGATETDGAAKDQEESFA